ncbi:MAG: hypothetical protein H0X17_01670, partial [Deltaproteobacteria bacterium]|nr:hypothetical protein [Deltaproteobacteria bacterium]
FAFIRLSDGARFRDPKFATSWTNAKAAGVIRCAYQVFRPAQASGAMRSVGRAASSLTPCGSK